MRLEKDSGYTPIQGFAPTSGGQLSGSYTPKSTVAVRFAADVAVTIGSVAITYSAGEGLVLVKGITYVFGTAVNVHVMGAL